jgi:hypothetical protein
MKPVVVYSRLTALPASIDMLEAESEANGFRMIARLRTEWTEGTNRFDREGEVLFGAHLDGRLIGVGGLRVRLENHEWAFLRSRRPPMATRIMACETSMRCS